MRHAKTVTSHMAVPFVWALLMAVQLAAAPLSPAQNGLLVEGNGVAFLGESHFLDEAQSLLAGYPEARRTMEMALGWELESNPNVILVGDREIFRKMTGNPLVTAFAVPEENLIVIHVSPAAANPYVLQETFTHELCHLLLHNHIGESSLPRWLDEGICQWISGSLGEIVAGDALDTSPVSIARHPIPMAALEDSFPAGGEPLLRAYAQSMSFVEYLISRHGRDGLHEVLRHLKEGHRVDRGIELALGISYQELERDWLRHIRAGNVWLIWASQHIYDILFFAGAVLTIMAFVRLWTRKRRLNAEDDADNNGDNDEFHPNGGGSL